MAKKHKTNSWKERNTLLWEKLVVTYHSLKESPSLKLILKFIVFILKLVFSIVVKKFVKHFFPTL